MTTATEPRFLYPQSRRYPFDEVCEQIVRALDERGWDVPGLSLKFDTYGSGAQKYRLLRSITGDDFKLRFGRVQGNLGRWNDTAAISYIMIPGKEIHVYENMSEMRTEVDFFAEFAQYLTDNVLTIILARPLVDPQDYLPPEELFRTIPNPWTAELTAHVGPIYTFGGHEDALRIHQGKADSHELEPANRYAFIGSGYRLASLRVPDNGQMPEVAYDGFKWCAIGEVSAETPIDRLNVPGHYRWPDREMFVFRVAPNRVDGVYVADHAVWEKRRRELFEQIKPRDRLTEEEVNQAHQARACTIMPIVEYALMTQADPTATYEQPIVLINRELDFDEVELVSGPWPECQYFQVIAGRSPEARALFGQAIGSRHAYYQTFEDELRQAYQDAVARLSDYFVGDEELTRLANAYSRHTFREVQLGPSFFGRIVDAATTARRLGLI